MVSALGVGRRCASSWRCRWRPEPPGPREGGPAPRPHPPPAARPRGAEREGSLLLLVEDHPVNREILARQLEAIGFVTDTAGDAAEALARFHAHRYGLVFTDIQLPGADGYALARGLRAEERGAGRPRVPIVALTASALRGERERCAAPAWTTSSSSPRRWPCSRHAAPLAARRELGGRAAAPRRPAIDSSALDELTGGDEQLNRDIVTRYLVALGEDLDALRRRWVTATSPACAATRIASPARAAPSGRTPSPPRRPAWSAR